MNDIVKENKKMGRKPSLSPDKIIETIKELQSDNNDVTPCIIRGRIGFGGLGNISSVLESYLKEQNGISLSNNILIETHILPPDLEDKRNMLLTDLTLQVSNFVLESDLLANNLAEKKARSAYENIIQHNQKITDELTQTIKMFDEVEVKNDLSNEQIIEIEARLEKEQTQSANLDKGLSKVNDELTRLNISKLDIEAILSTSEAKNKSLEKLITKIETRLEDSIKDKEISVCESIKIKTQLTETISKLKASEESSSQLKSGMNTLRTDKDKVISKEQSKNSDLSSKLEKAQSEHQINKEKLITITTQFSAQKDVLKEKNERITDLKSQLTELKTNK